MGVVGWEQRDGGSWESGNGMGIMEWEWGLGERDWDGEMGWRELGEVVGWGKWGGNGRLGGEGVGWG